MQYQVALSFAGEQRDYVERVAEWLQARSIAVFYDGFEEVQLWGKNGAEVFHEIFSQQAAYVVMFISQAYVDKPWTRHERRSILSRAIQEQRECLIPVRFDGTPLPGLPEDVIYLCANKNTPEQLAAKIVEKLGIKPFGGKASHVPPPRMTSPTGEVVFDYSKYDGRYVIGSEVQEFETRWTKASNKRIHVYNYPPSIHGIALAKGCSSIAQVANAKSLDYTSSTRSPRLREIVVLRNVNCFYAALHLLKIKDDSRGDDRDELRFRYAIQSDGSDNFEEFKGI